MADKKISELTALTGAALVDTDLIPVVDTSATTTKKISLEELKIGLDTPSGFIRKTGGTFSGAIDVTGTVTADGLTVDGSGTITNTASGVTTGLSLKNNTAGGNNRIALDFYTANTKYVTLEGGYGTVFPEFNVKVGNTPKLVMKADSGGDISFYEDTGTTPKFFWDASAESLGIGNLPAAELHVRAVSDPEIRIENGNLTSQGKLNFTSGSTSDGYIGMTPNTGILNIESGRNASWGGKVTISTDTLERLRVNNNGDISFYEDTGTTPKFFWDASAESLGIGTSSPASTLNIASSATNGPVFRIENTDTSIGSGEALGSIEWYSNDLSTGGTGVASAIKAVDMNGFGTAYGLTFTTGFVSGGVMTTAERMRIDSSGNVGINTTGTDAKLNINGGADGSSVLSGRSDGGNGNNARFKITAFADGGGSNYGGGVGFQTRSTTNVFSEAMRITSSGAVLVGKTSTSGAVVGLSLEPAGVIKATRSSNIAGFFNREDSDGSIVSFAKDDTVVGNIGSNASAHLTMGSGDTGVLFNAATDKIHPWNMSTQGIRDGAIDLGVSVSRFKDLYLSGGVYLGGTGAANKLDDYEEGTWTPSLSAGSFGHQYNYTYTKIGRVVHITGYFAAPTGLPSSTLTISGLPFAGNASYQMSLLWYNGSSSVIAAAHLGGGSTTLEVRPIGGWPSTFAELSVQMTYITNA